MLPKQENNKKSGLKIFLICFIVVAILVAGFFIVRAIINTYNDSTYEYYDYDYNSEEDEELSEEDIDGMLDDEDEVYKIPDEDNDETIENDSFFEDENAEDTEK